MSLSRHEFIRNLVAVSAAAGGTLSIVPREADAFRLGSLGSLFYKNILLVQRIFAAKQASTVGQPLSAADQGALDRAHQRAIEVSNLSPYMSGNQNATISASDLSSITNNVKNRLPTILNAADSFVTNALGGSTVIAHMTDALSTVQTTVLSFADLEGGLLSQAFVTLASLRDNLGQSPNRNTQRVHIFAIRADSAIYNQLLQGPSPAPIASGQSAGAYGTPHTIGLTGKSLGAFFTSAGNPNNVFGSIIQPLEILTPKISTALIPFAVPIVVFSQLIKAIIGISKHPSVSPTAIPSPIPTILSPQNDALQQIAKFAVDADQIALEVEGGSIAQIATTFAMLRLCARSVDQNGNPIFPPNHTVSEDGVYIYTPSSPTKIAVLAAREDGPGYKFLTAHGYPHC